MEYRYGCTRREYLAVKLYEGGEMPRDMDEFYLQKAPFQTLNLLMMQGTEGERVRVCVEDQKPNGLFIRRWEETAQALTDVFTVMCRCAMSRKEAGCPLPAPLSRGERGVNFRLMEAAGGTYAFTSTTQGEMLDSFVRKKQDPHGLHITLGEGVPYLDFTEFLGSDYYYEEQHEILLPPMARMECTDSWVQVHENIGEVKHYAVRFTGIEMPREIREEGELLPILESLAAEAADGLDDLRENKAQAAVLQDEGHPYWRWKEAFRQLTLRRMYAVYQSFYR